MGLWWLNDKTRFGAMVRAGMDNRETTMGLGINYGLVSSAIFFLGTFVGGITGFIGLPLVAVHPPLAFDILLLALIVIVIGGVGSIQGTLVGAMVIGLIDSLGRAYFPVMAYFTIYLVFIITLFIKPSGLLGRSR